MDRHRGRDENTVLDEDRISMVTVCLGKKGKDNILVQLAGYV